VNREQTRAKILNVVSTATGVELNHGDVISEGRLDSFLGLDSIASLEIVVALEKAFGIRIPSEVLTIEKLGDLEGLTDLISGKELPA